MSLAAVVLSAGCTADASAPAPTVETVTRSTEGPIIVDLRDAERAWLFDPSEGDLPLEDTTLICPNGAFMPLRHWLWDQEELLGLEGLDDTERALFALGPTEEVTSTAIEQVVDDCVQQCKQCPDGAWICVDPCHGDSVWNEDALAERDAAESGGGTEEPPPGGSGGSASRPRGDGDSGGGTPEPYDPRDPAPPMY